MNDCGVVRTTWICVARAAAHHAIAAAVSVFHYKDFPRANLVATTATAIALSPCPPRFRKNAVDTYRISG